MRPLLFVYLLIAQVVAMAQPTTALYQEEHRPQFHFTPAKNWMNDPNGLVYFRGEYHLFYQYNPYGIRWGHMSWGHAVSKDLVRWRHLPMAIPEENGYMIFSGSCVVDVNNTTGFARKKGQVPMVAIYTAHIISDTTRPDNYRQVQHIAYSLDNGRTWTQYANNPVLDINKKDFRDPKVFWYEPGKKWIMALVLAQERKIQLYGSKDLKRWEHLSDFGPAGDIKDIWECPDLLLVPVEGTSEKKWVLMNSQQYTVQYFVGSFDGKSFRSENKTGKIYRQDYGPDYYAVVTYNNLPNNSKPVSIGWANNWAYGNDIPTWPWRSAMALPRQLLLRKNNAEWILAQQPVAGIEKLRTDLFRWKGTVNGTKKLPVKGQTLEILFELQTKATAGLRLAVGNDHYFTIGYDTSGEKLFIDRSNASDTTFSAAFNTMSRYEAALKPKNGKIALRIFFDKSIVEVFANNGELVFTSQVFTSKKNDGIEVWSEGGSEALFQCWKLRSAWR